MHTDHTLQHATTKLLHMVEQLEQAVHTLPRTQNIDATTETVTEELKKELTQSQAQHAVLQEALSEQREIIAQLEEELAQARHMSSHLQALNEKAVSMLDGAIGTVANMLDSEAIPPKQQKAG